MIFQDMERVRQDWAAGGGRAVRSGAVGSQVRVGNPVCCSSKPAMERLLLIKTCFSLPPGIANETQINEGLLTFSALANKKARL